MARSGACIVVTLVFLLLPAVSGAQDFERCSAPGTEFGVAGTPAEITDTISIFEHFEILEAEVYTEITHTMISDLTIVLTSPAGTEVTLHSGAGGSAEDIAVTWADDGAANAEPYDCACRMQPSGPGAMADLIGELSKGDWSLHIVDSLPEKEGGVLVSWCLAIEHPRSPTLESCSAPGVAIGTDGAPIVEDTITLRDDYLIEDVEVSVDITHPWIGDLVLSLESPRGSRVLLQENSGGSADAILVTYSTLGAVHGAPFDCNCLLDTPSPGALTAAFQGETTLGDWTLVCEDTLTGDSGTLNEWCTRMFALPRAFATACSAPGLAFGESGGGEQSVSDTLTFVTDDAAMVEDLVVYANISHAFAGDILLTLKSPAGTEVTLHDELGGGGDDLDVYWAGFGRANGAPYDCHCFMQPSGPGAFADYHSDAVDGDWVITCNDDFFDDDGVLNEWCLHFARQAEREFCSLPELPFGDGVAPDEITDSIEVAQSSHVQDVEVVTGIAHEWIAELEVVITSPGGTSVVLHDNTGKASDGIHITWSDYGVDNGSVSFAAGVEVAMEPSNPDQPLGAFAGEMSEGVWTLTCRDPEGYELSGELDLWCLRLYLDVGVRFMRGDCNNDGHVAALGDALFLLRYAFSGGSAPPCLDAADVNGNNTINGLSDTLYLLSWGFLSGPAPPEPGPESCGSDSDSDDLDCETVSATCGD